MRVKTVERLKSYALNIITVSAVLLVCSYNAKAQDDGDNCYDIDDEGNIINFCQANTPEDPSVLDDEPILPDWPILGPGISAGAYWLIAPETNSYHKVPLNNMYFDMMHKRLRKGNLDTLYKDHNHYLHQFDLDH